ncbi:MAG: lipid-A-disaccharide synthase [Thermogutta sp.]
MTNRIFFSAGEPSGDQHGAALITALRLRLSEITCVGFGGARMAQAGCHLLADLTSHAVMGFLRPIVQLHHFYRFYRQAIAEMEHHRPDAVVLIDYPGFNWHLARAAKSRGIPVFFYGPPQIWAWARWRVRKMRRWVDHALCWLPFEQHWLAARGCSATYVGHPFFEECATAVRDPELVTQLTADPRPLLTILPGSRDQEVHANGRSMLKVAARLRQQIPNLRVAVAAFRPHQAELMEGWAHQLGVPALVLAGKTPELIQSATCCLAVSGSVSLELLYHEKPSVILYRISPLAARIERFVRRVKYITLVNLLYHGGAQAAEIAPEDATTPPPTDALFPEFLTARDVTAEICRRLAIWLTDAQERERVVAVLRELKVSLGWEGAVDRAADWLIRQLARPQCESPEICPHSSFALHKSVMAAGSRGG